jgi:cytochrome c5
MKVPHVLHDGADSIGIVGALARVYVSIGSFHEEWLKHFNLLVGGKRQTPFSIAAARRDSPYFRATLDRAADVAAFFVRAAGPQPLAEAPDGARHLADSEATVARGRQVFAENCAACHSSYNKMPPPPAGIVRDTKAWDDWTASADFKSRMAVLAGGADFLSDNFLSTDRRYPVSVVGTNACSTLASNGLEGHVWDNFSSATYKALPAAGTILLRDPFTGADQPYAMPGGGRGYQRVPSLVSMWASAPYLHNNSLGLFNGDPSVAGRMAAFQDGVEKLLWPQKRLGLQSVYRTTRRSWLTIDKSYLPVPLFYWLKLKGMGSPDSDDAVRLGPIPKGTPVNLLANIDLDISLDPAKLLDFVTLAMALDTTLRGIRTENLDDAGAAARLRPLVPALLKLSKCPDLVTDGGHLFGTQLADGDKRSLIAFLKRL